MLTFLSDSTNNFLTAYSGSTNSLFTIPFLWASLTISSFFSVSTYELVLKSMSPFFFWLWQHHTFRVLISVAVTQWCLTNHQKFSNLGHWPFYFVCSQQFDQGTQSGSSADPGQELLMQLQSSGNLTGVGWSNRVSLACLKYSAVSIQV